MDITHRTDYDILEITPTGPLREQEIEQLAEELEGIRRRNRRLCGLLIHTKTFPGYESFSDVIAHSKLIKNRLDMVDKVAIATDSPVAGLAELVGRSLAKVDVKRFSYDAKDEAEKWLLN